MLVMILENVPASWKGELSRWLIEPKSGVFLGNPSARVRDELWKRGTQKCKEGSMIQIWNDRNPQGYSYRVHGTPSRELLDFDGMALVRIKSKTEKGRKKE